MCVYIYIYKQLILRIPSLKGLVGEIRKQEKQSFFLPVFTMIKLHNKLFHEPFQQIHSVESFIFCRAFVLHFM